LNLANLINQDHIVEEVKVDPHALKWQPVDAVSDWLSLFFHLFFRFFLVIRSVGPIFFFIPDFSLLFFLLYRLHDLLRLRGRMLIIVFDLEDHLFVLDPAHLLHEGYRFITSAWRLFNIILRLLLLSLIQHLRKLRDKRLKDSLVLSGTSRLPLSARGQLSDHAHNARAVTTVA
jgi:hypothetical protein